MTYISGTLTDSNAPATLYAAVATALGTAGFTLVDTVVIATKTHKVWKSAAASNVANLDWYLDVAYTTTGVGSIWFIPFEFYDPTSDLGYRGPYNTSGTVIDATTFSRYGATGYALETNWSPSAATTAMGLSAPATSFAYWISLTTDRVIALGSQAPSLIYYAGFYELDSLYAAKAGAAAYPLVVATLTNGYSPVNMGLTRMPPFTTINWSNMADATAATPGYSQSPTLPAGNTLGYPFVASRTLLLSASTPQPGRWGYFRDLAVMQANSVRGDTVLVGADTWVMTTSATYAAIFKAA